MLVWNRTIWQSEGTPGKSTTGLPHYDFGAVSCAAPDVCMAIDQDPYSLGFPADPMSLNGWSL